MRYYIADNDGNTYCDVSSRPEADLLLEEYVNDLKNEGKTADEIKALGLEVIEAN